MCDKKPTPQDLRDVSLRLGYPPINLSDEALQAEIDEFFDEESNMIHELLYPDEVYETELILKGVVKGYGKSS